MRQHVISKRKSSVTSFYEERLDDARLSQARLSQVRYSQRFSQSNQFADIAPPPGPQAEPYSVTKSNAEVENLLQEFNQRTGRQSQADDEMFQHYVSVKKFSKDHEDKKREGSVTREDRMSVEGAVAASVEGAIGDPAPISAFDPNTGDRGLGIPLRVAVIPPEAGYPGLPINDAPPSHKEGLRYQNTMTRPRRELVFRDAGDPDDTGEWHKKEFGNEGGELYPVWFSTPWDLREFGLGVAMYFQTLQLLAMAFFISGVIQMQTVKYYKSDKYSDGQPGVPGMLQGSAICTRHSMVCLDQECSEIGRQNLCHLGMPQAYLDLTNTLLLLIMFSVVSAMQDRIADVLDEAMQTASDYSVLVDDPGPEDCDPDEWRDFFEQFGHVTFITVAKNNGPLLQALAHRRAVMREIIMIIGNGEPVSSSGFDEAGNMEEAIDVDGVKIVTAIPVAAQKDDRLDNRRWGGMDFKSKIEDVAANPFQPDDDPSNDGVEKTRNCLAKTGFFGMKPMTTWVKALATANEEVQEALREAHTWIPSKVFVTFETETAQRKCLAALSQGTLTAALDLGKGKMPKEYLFKGENVLSIKESCEPANVFWEDVDITFGKRIKQQGFTLVVTSMMVVGSVIACKALQISSGAASAALWISISNIMVPEVIRQLCFKVEDHVSLNDQQMSLYFKLTFFRWMNTAVVLYLITDFTDFLTAKAMNQVQAVLIADAFTTPIVRTLNPMEAINQAIVSRYAPTQEKMNTYFLGSVWYPAERYADMTKTLFLALFYSALLPSGLFLTSAGYTLGYVADKYSLLRKWWTPSELSNEITVASRFYMVMAVYAHAVMTMIFFAEFPFDNICKRKSPEFLSHDVFKMASREFNVTTDLVHERCDQSATARFFGLFTGDTESLFSSTMYDKQKRIVKMYSYLVIALSIFYFVVFFGMGIVCGCYHLFAGSYDNNADAQLDRFSFCNIQAFIPFITHPTLAYPLVAADLTQFDCKYLTFELPDFEAYQKQCLYNPVEFPGIGPDQLREIFSVVKYYEPPDLLPEAVELFMQCDKNHNKVLDFDEFLLGADILNIPRSMARTIFNEMDVDNSGSISIDEFLVKFRAHEFDFKVGE